MRLERLLKDEISLNQVFHYCEVTLVTVKHQLLVYFLVQVQRYLE